MNENDNESVTSNVTPKKECTRCFEKIDYRATVCPNCQVNQGIIGSFTNFWIFAGSFIAIVSAVTALHGATRTEIDRNAIAEVRSVTVNTIVKYAGRVSTIATFRLRERCNWAGLDKPPNRDEISGCTDTAIEAVEAMNGLEHVVKILGKEAEPFLRNECKYMTWPKYIDYYSSHVDLLTPIEFADKSTKSNVVRFNANVGDIIRMLNFICDAGIPNPVTVN
ncbi:MAG: hypothetical protein AAF542_00125 [Pseudomonadota bacterium]